MSRRRDMLRRLDEDIRDHIARETSDNIERGMAPDAARCAALRRFGNVQLVKERTREVWIAAAAEQLWQDVKFGLRMLRRNAGFATIAILTLAIGIAVNTAVFGVVNTVLLRPLPYPAPDRLVVFSVGVTSATAGRFKQGIEGADFLEWRSRAKSFDKLAGYIYSDKTIAGRNISDQVRAISIAGDFWSLLGTKAALGHLFEPGKSQDEAVLSHSVFEAQFKGDRGIIGHIVTIDGKPVTVAGVLPSDFRFYFPQDWWSGLAPAEAGVFISVPPLIRPKPNRLFVVGRLKQGISISRALTELRGIEGAILKTYPDLWFPGVSRMALIPLQTQLLGGNRQGLLILQCAGLFVLLIACANIANLLLARGAARKHEIGIRTAIGAGAFRILRQFLAEGIVLAVFGGAIGLLLAKGIVLMFIHFGPHSLPRLSATSIDSGVIAFAFALCLGSGVVFGFGPAIALWKTNLQDGLKEGARNSSSGSGGIRVRRFLVAAEIALAVVLLTGAGLMVKSFWQMYTNPPGFDPDNTLVVKVALSGPQYAGKAKQVSYFRELLDRLRSIPGIKAFGLANAQDYIIQSKDPANPPRVDEFRDSLVSPGYFQAVGMRLLKGRWFIATDPPDATVINETMARRMFGDRDPLGQRIDGLGRQVLVIGVVANLKYAKLDADPGPEIFRAYAPNLYGGNVNMTLAIRMPSDPLGVAPTLRHSIGSIDPTQPIYDIETLQQALAASIAVRRFELFLLLVFATAALIMALIGVYGVIAYSVTQRTKEIGIRMALGAQRAQVIRMIV
ncbi:MAG TPA: ABC transporter permease, partial [Bryobacteraceae bacterium]|nr:ABC transporter permease [Bryobacteraceae bacterium]